MTEKYKNPSLSTDERVEDLLGQMTLQEKIGQLNQRLLGWHAYKKENGKARVTEAFTTMVAELGLGGMYGLFRADPWSAVTLETGLHSREGAEIANELQRHMVEHTRLGIPLFICEDCPHGFMSIGGTVFPVGIHLASTWDPALAGKVGAIVGRECRAKGGNVAYGPVVDIARDPRWSRVEEGFGEDTYLAARMGEAMVKGIQGDSLATDHTALSTLKHFTAYGDPEGGHNAGPARIGERELREIALPAFKAGVDAGAQSLMASYNEIDGIPCHKDRRLLTGILREEWGFEGFVVSDMTGIDCLQVHGVAGNLAECAALALTAGVDLSLWDEAYTFIGKALEEGLITQETIDQGRAARVGG